MTELRWLFGFALFFGLGLAARVDIKQLLSERGSCRARIPGR
jgi:hypothetical protein